MFFLGALLVLKLTSATLSGLLSIVLFVNSAGAKNPTPECTWIDGPFGPRPNPECPYNP
jgi:hypothetical protein